MFECYSAIRKRHEEAAQRQKRFIADYVKISVGPKREALSHGDKIVSRGNDMSKGYSLDGKWARCAINRTGFIRNRWYMLFVRPSGTLIVTRPLMPGDSSDSDTYNSAHIDHIDLTDIRDVNPEPGVDNSKAIGKAFRKIQKQIGKLEAMGVKANVIMAEEIR